MITQESIEVSDSQVFSSVDDDDGDDEGSRFFQDVHVA